MTVPHFFPLGSFCKSLRAGGDQIPNVLKTSCVLITVISPGLSVEMRDLFAPVDGCVIHPARHHVR